MTKPKKDTIFICTLGGTWLVVPEVLGYILPDIFPIYPAKWWKDRNVPTKHNISEVWVITTSGDAAINAIDSLKEYWGSISDDKPTLRIFRPLGIKDIVTDKDNKEMAELIYRLAIKAQESNNIIWSLAGGRKTMSSLLQKAASVFGATSLYHVASGSIADSFRAKQITTLIPDNVADDLHIVDMGKYEPFEGLQWQSTLTCDKFPIKQVESDSELFYMEAPSLYEEIERRQRDASIISRNYFFELLRADQRDNFRSLYRLAPAAIDKLKNEYIGSDLSDREDDIAWLRRLPKAELHCHLGGIATVDELKEIASVVIKAYDVKNTIPYSRRQLNELINEVNFVHCNGKPETQGRLSKLIKKAEESNIPKDLAVAKFIDRASYETLDFLSRIGGLELQSGAGLSAYRQAGDLQGSNLLRTPEAIRAACIILYRKAIEDNVKYLEVRCSPANYEGAGFDGYNVLSVIRDSFKEISNNQKCQVELIIIGTRHENEARFRKNVEIAVKGADKWKESPRVVGFDLAGEESTKSPAELRDLFEPLFKRCLKLTIHAGETETAENIWQAVYHLNADRIGHGLKLIDNLQLLEYIRDRGTAIELCPTSNDQVVGFIDHFKNDNKFYEYPLKAYINAGLRISICTDNPGISRTDWSTELLKAAILTQGGLSKWEILGILRTGFQAAFLPQPEKAKLLKDADEMIYKCVL